jgi:hypothetical protein
MHAEAPVDRIAFDQVAAAIEQHQAGTRARLDLLWTYYRNPMTVAAAAGGVSRPRIGLAQERGLPDRLTGARPVASDDRLASTREIVIENDIAWRIHTMVDFMFGRPVTIVSTARDAATRRRIERLLDRVWDASGGVSLLNDVGLLGHIYGHVDLLVRSEGGEEIRIEPVEPTRGVPVLDPHDYRRVVALAIRGEPTIAPRATTAAAADSRGLGRWLHDAAHPSRARLRAMLGLGGAGEGPVTIEVFTATRRRVYQQDAPEAAARLIADGPALAGEIDADDDRGGLHGPPISHIQNISQPFRYAGLSEVEPLIPLQNELNTRLSDRASRVTMQSFKMYLARGLEGVANLTVGPGQVWSTDNPEASIEAFGGDGASPSEDAHIQEIREAMDKASGVPPLASGVVRAKIGNLTSENALRVTLMGLLSKTARKRVTYGRGMAEACRLVLLAAHRAGVLLTEPEDRGVRIEWPDPLPREERDVLDAALKKLQLGVSRERVLSEIGYSASDPGVT